MGYEQIPVLGVNLGRLGFLADLDPEQLRCCFAKVVAGDYKVTQHLMFECVVENADCGTAVKGQRYLGLNEVAIHSMPPFHMLDLHLHMDGNAVAQFSGDGLIISTPIGSTAHNLSAGGPILGQELAAFVVTPICPHSLTHRPVVDSADKTYTITLDGREEQALVSVDGQETIPLFTEGARVPGAGVISAREGAGPELLPYTSREAPLGCAAGISRRTKRRLLAYWQQPATAHDRV
jgi:NAD+ kinase